MLLTADIPCELVRHPFREALVVRTSLLVDVGTKVAPAVGCVRKSADIVVLLTNAPVVSVVRGDSSTPAPSDTVCTI